MIRVFLADDHPIVRTGLKALLGLADDIEVFGEAIDGRKVLLAAERDDWAVDVLVLDISLPRVNGIEVLRRLQTMRPELPVLMLSRVRGVVVSPRRMIAPLPNCFSI